MNFADYSLHFHYLGSHVAAAAALLEAACCTSRLGRLAASAAENEFEAVDEAELAAALADIAVAADSAAAVVAVSDSVAADL